MLVGLYVDHVGMGWRERLTACCCCILKICIILGFWVFFLCLQSNSLPSHIKITVNRTNIFEDSFQQVCRLRCLLHIYVLNYYLNYWITETKTLSPTSPTEQLILNSIFIFIQSLHCKHLPIDQKNLTIKSWSLQCLDHTTEGPPILHVFLSS